MLFSGMKVLENDNKSEIEKFLFFPCINGFLIDSNPHTDNSSIGYWKILETIKQTPFYDTISDSIYNTNECTHRFPFQNNHNQYNQQTKNIYSHFKESWTTAYQVLLLGVELTSATLPHEQRFTMYRTKLIVIVIKLISTK